MMRLFTSLQAFFLLLLTISASAANPPPTIDQVATVVLNEDFDDTHVALTGIFTGPYFGGPFIAVSATSSDPNLLATPTVIYDGRGSTADLILSSTPNLNGTVVVTVTVADLALGMSGSKTLMSFTVDIHSVNDPPYFVMGLPTNITEDGGWYPIFLNLVAPGPPNESTQRLSLVVTPLDASLIEIGSSTIDQISGVISFMIRPRPNAWGTTSLVVTVIDDGGDQGLDLNSFSRVGSLTIAPVNDPPVLAALRPLAVGIGGQVTITDSDLRLSDVDNPSPSTLCFTLDTVPLHGSLRLSGVALAAHATFTQADITAGLLTYRHDGSGSGADGFGVLYTDGVIAAPLGPLGISVAVAGRALPSVALLGTPAVWFERGPPAAPAASAEVIDGDSPSFNGGFLNVSISFGEGAGDTLAFAAQGVGSDEVSLTGATINVGGRPVGTWSGGDGRALEVRFTSNDATPAAAQDILRALRFWSTSGDPSATTRIIRVVISDGDAGASIPTTTSVTVVPYNNPPVSDQVAVATLPGIPILFRLSAVDPDSRSLTWATFYSPASARIELVDAVTGWFRLVPTPGASGSAVASVTVSDGVNPPVLVPVTVVIGSVDAAAPFPAADPPRTCAVGDLLDLTIPFDCSDLPAATVLNFAAATTAPVGLSVTRAGPTAVRLVWGVPSAQPTNTHLRFTIIASSQDGSAVGALPMSLLILPRPSGAN